MKRIGMAAIMAAVLSMAGCDHVKSAFLMHGCTKQRDTFYFNEDLSLDKAVGTSTVSCENAKHNWFLVPSPPEDHTFVPGMTGTPDPKTRMLK